MHWLCVLLLLQHGRRRVQGCEKARDTKASRAALHADSGCLRGSTLLDAHLAMNSNPQVQQPRGPKLKFCPESNDLLYPKVCTPPPLPGPRRPVAHYEARVGSCAVSHAYGGFDLGVY